VPLTSTYVQPRHEVGFVFRDITILQPPHLRNRNDPCLPCLHLTMKLSTQLLALYVSHAAGFSPLVGPSTGSLAHGKLALSSSDKYMESLAKTGGLPGSAEEASRVVRLLLTQQKGTR
jgi:hypothetical protein